MFSPVSVHRNFRPYLLGSTCGLLLLCGLVLVLMNKVAAHHQHHEIYAEVSIDGVAYGRLGNFADLKRFADADFRTCHEPNHELCSANLNGVLDLALHHSFITENSLFQWAQNNSRNPHSEPRDIAIILRNRFGDEVDRFTLLQTKPSKWSIEVAESSSGGFSEKVQVFVQDIIHIHGPL